MPDTQKKGIAFDYPSCDPAGIRTQGPYIKSVLLYQLSYGIERFSFGGANIAVILYIKKQLIKK
jgi:hypothetical protein